MKNVFAPKQYLVNGKTIEQPFAKAKIYIAVFVIVFFGCFVFINTDNFIFQFNELLTIFKSLFLPHSYRDIYGNITYASWASYFQYMWGLKTILLYTVKMCFIGTVIGSAVAIPYALICSQNINTNRWSLRIARWFLNFVRTIPTLVVALIATFFMGYGYVPGIIALSIFSFSILAKMLYEIIETIDMGPCEALESCGANRTNIIKFAVLPQIMPILLGYILYIFEINIRASVILGYVGAGGIGMEMQEAIENRRYDKVGAILIILMFLVIILQILVGKVRGKYDEKT